MRGLFTILATILLLAGCCKPCMQQSTSTQKDSTSVRESNDTVERVKDTSITIPADSALIQALFECDSLRRVQLKGIVAIPGKNVKPSLTMNGNTATFKCQVDSLEVALTYIERNISSAKSIFEAHSNQDTIVVENRVNYVTGFQWFQIWAGRIFLIALLVYGGYKFLSSKFSTPINLLKWVKSLLSKGKAD